jgi:hypothetical protein
MIKSTLEPFQDFINYLNNLNLTDIPCQIVVLPDYKTLGNNLEKNGDIGFAVYKPKFMVMYICGDIEGIKEINRNEFNRKLSDEGIYDDILECIAHEYKHHLQWVNNKKFDENSEDEAQSFAEHIMIDYREFKDPNYFVCEENENIFETKEYQEKMKCVINCFENEK